MISSDEFKKRLDKIFLQHHLEFIPQANEELMSCAINEYKNILNSNKRRMPWDKTAAQEAEEYIEATLLDVIKSECHNRLIMTEYILNQD